LGISARKTAFILRNVFSIPCSYQTVLNYTESAAYHCHKFNLAKKGKADRIQAGDEAYIKVSGENNYTFFFIGAKSRKITAYHVDETRDTLPATVAMNEAIRTAEPDEENTLVTDGNPSYGAGIHFINQSHSPTLTHKKVIGLQNLDSESEEFRPFKQLTVKQYCFAVLKDLSAPISFIQELPADLTPRTVPLPLPPSSLLTTIS